MSSRMNDSYSRNGSNQIHPQRMDMKKRSFNNDSPKIIIIIQILITNLNIDKSLAITRNKMIRSPIDLQIWDTLREKLIKVDITAKDSMRRKADQEIAKIDMKKEDKINSTILKVKTKIKMVCKISNKNLINPQ